MGSGGAGGEGWGALRPLYSVFLFFFIKAEPIKHLKSDPLNGNQDSVLFP